MIIYLHYLVWTRTCEGCLGTCLSQISHSQTSGKRPPKVSSLSGRLRELRQHCAKSFLPWHMVTAETYLMFQKFYSSKHSILRKNPYFPLRIFPLLLSRNAIMLQHLYYPILQYWLSNGRLGEVKNSGKFQTFSLKSGSGRLREVANIVIWLGNFLYFGKLVAYERWSQPEVRLYLSPGLGRSQQSTLTLLPNTYLSSCQPALTFSHFEFFLILILNSFLLDR